MTLKKDMILLDWRVARDLRLVVSLIDRFTGRTPIGDIRLSVYDQTIKVSKNLSGDYLFSNVPGNMVYIRVESDYYFDVEREIKISELDPKHPVETIVLQTKPCYPFPGGTTLIRGMVRDMEDNPVPGAHVKVVGKKVDNKTTEKGEFVLYFKGLTDDDIIDGKYVKGKVADNIILKAVHEERKGRRRLNKVEEGRTSVLKQPIQIK